MRFLVTHLNVLSAAFLLVLPGLAGFASPLGAQDDSTGVALAERPEDGARYRGPGALADPQDPFQSVKWTLGTTLPRRNRLGMGSRSVTQRLEYDLDRDVVLVSYHSGQETVLPSRSMTRSQFADVAIRNQLRASWIDSNRRVVADAQGTGGEGINLNLGVELPFTEKLFGPGAPNLRVTGSEQITFSGTSTWVKDAVSGERGGGSLFPKLDMRQRLDVALTGTIGTKLSIDVRQNSDALTPLENAIRIRYRGEEDEIIQNIELGNTNLSLPRSQFVSVSSRTEGLFGVKANGQVGDVLWTGIASRQEGETGSANIVGGATDEVRRVEDWRFQPRRFFFIANPEDPEPQLIAGTLRVYLDDRNPDNDNEMGARGARVWLNPGTGPSFPDRLPVKPHRGSFHLLEDVVDYTFELNEVYQFPVLRLNNSLSPDQVLAVAYDMLDGQGRRVSVGTIPEAPADSLDLKIIRPGVGVEGWGEDLTVGPWAPARRLEIKSVYSLGARNIDPETFELSVELDRGGNNPVVITNEFGKTSSLLEILGLDQRDNLQVDRFVPDGKVDPEYINYTEGLVYLPDLRPFDPDTTDIAGVNPQRFPGSDAARLRKRSWPVVNGQARPDTLGWTLNAAESTPWTRMKRSRSEFVVAETAPGIYDKRSDVLSRQQAQIHKYTLVARMRSAVSTLQLNALGDILQGSETVRLDGIELERNVDYRINYDTGIIELLNEQARLPGARLDVSYSYDSPFARGSRSLVGMNLARNASPSAPFTYSTSWLHESRGVPDTRPRLGNEPTKTTVGDFAAQVRLAPWGLTRLADSLPLVRTSVPSRVDLSGALGLSLPNPNTRGVVYVDDMEGSETVNAASLNRTTWFYSSAPERAIDLIGGTPLDVTPKATDRGQILWFSPNTVRLRDVNPREDARDAADDLVPALEIVYVPYENAGINGSWAGLSAPLSFEGVDLTKSQFIEVWVNDFKGYGNRRGERRGEMLIDIGSVSEDAVWDPLTPPAPANRRLDLEDKNRSGGRIEQNEDTGLDGQFSQRNLTGPIAVEPEAPADGRKSFSIYTRAQDPSGDDRQPEIQTSAKEETLTQRIAKFAGINGTERNEFPDTEDLDDDSVLDLDNNYREYRIRFADEALTDNGRDFPPHSNATQEQIDDNGWRLYRIPLSEFHQEVGVVDMSLVKHVRIWFRGFDPGDTLDVQIASLEIVGNRWELSNEVPDPNLESGREFRVAVVNNKETPDYFEPFQVERINNVKEREQSLSMEFVNFERDADLRAFYTLPDVRDYTLYQDFSFYINPRFALMDTTDEVEFYMRFVSNASTDSLSYYEVATVVTEQDPRRAPGPTPQAGGWINFDVPIAALSQLKIGVPESVRQDTFLVGPHDEPGRATPPRADLGNGLKATVRGTPSMSRIRRLTVGLRNKSGHDLGMGELWYNELRMGDVRRDTGVAGIASANIVLADVATLGLSYSATSADFLRLGQTTGSGTSVQANNITTSINLHKFMEPLRLNAPLRMSWRNDTATPKFLQNSDIEYTGNLDTGTNISKRAQQSYQLSLARDPRGHSPFWAQYTIDALRLGGSLTRSQNTLPTQIDTTSTLNGNIGYSLNLGGVRPVRLLNRMDFFPLPRAFSVDVGGGRSTRRRYTRELGQLAQTLRDSTTTRTGTLRFSTSLQPVRLINYTYTENRDLIDAHYGADSSIVRLQTPESKLLGINLGRRLNQSHNTTFNYSPGFAGFFRPRFTWSGNSSVDNSPTNTSPRADSTITVANNTSTSSFNLTLPLGKIVNSVFSRSGPTRLQQQEAPGDSAGPPATAGSSGPSAGDQLRMLFTRIIRVGDVQGSLQLRNTHNIGGIHGTVPLAYKLGLSRDPGLGSTAFPVVSANNFTENTSEQTQWRGSTSLVMLNQLTLDMTYQHTDRSSRAGSGGVGRVQTETTWPEIRFNWGSLHEKVPFLRKLFADFRPQASNYRKSTAVSGTNLQPKETTTITTGWTPLISLQGTFQGGWRTTFATDVTRSETLSERQASLPVISTRSTVNYRVNLEKSFRRVSGSRTREVTVNLDMGYNKISSRTESSFVAEDIQDNLTLSAGTTVPFTRTISGTFRLNFAQNRQPNRGFTRSSLGLSFQTGFRF